MTESNSGAIRPEVSAALAGFSLLTGGRGSVESIAQPQAFRSLADGQTAAVPPTRAGFLPLGAGQEVPRGSFFA